MAFSAVWALGINLATLPIYTGAYGILLLSALNVFSIFITWKIVRQVGIKLHEAFGLISSVYALLMLNMMLVVQFDFSLNSIIISIIGLAAALLWVIFGFRLRNRTMRLFGLIFSFFSLGKLFFVDLFFLPTELRIISYFVFGLIFMAISFVYQFFSRKFKESEAEVVSE